MTWALMLPLIKKFGPWLLVVAVVFGIYQLGRSHGAEKWRSQYDSALEQRDAEHAANAQLEREVVVLKDAIDRHNEAMRRLEEDHHNQTRKLDKAHKEALRRQAESYQRAVNDARDDVQGLQQRLNELSACEVCDGAWSEVMK